MYRWSETRTRGTARCINQDCSEYDWPVEVMLTSDYGTMDMEPEKCTGCGDYLEQTDKDE